MTIWVIVTIIRRLKQPNWVHSGETFDPSFTHFFPYKTLMADLLRSAGNVLWKGGVWNTTAALSQSDSANSFWFWRCSVNRQVLPKYCQKSEEEQRVPLVLGSPWACLWELFCSSSACACPTARDPAPHLNPTRTGSLVFLLQKAALSIWLKRGKWCDFFCFCHPEFRGKQTANRFLKKKKSLVLPVTIAIKVTARLRFTWKHETRVETSYWTLKIHPSASSNDSV